MCQTNRFPSVPKNLICCQSPVIKWSSCLTHRHSSNTPLLPAGLPKLGLLAGLWMTAWKPRASTGRSLRSSSPWGLTFNWEAQPRAKAKPDTRKSRWGRTIRSGRRGVLESCRAGSQVRGGAGMGWTFWDVARRPLAQGSPEFLPQVCKK